VLLHPGLVDAAERFLGAGPGLARLCKVRFTARVARLGPVFWLRISIRGLN
jgi:hypothetical protein